MTPRHTLSVEPISARAFTPFGTVMSLDRVEQGSINAGTCTRFHRLAAVPVRGEGAEAIVSLFRAEPIALPFQIATMERHPDGAQAFWPLSGHPWLVAVAPDRDGAPGAPVVFGVPGDVGVAYAPGVWHHPLMALDERSDFLVVDRDGLGDNLELADYAAPYTIAPAQPQNAPQGTPL